MARRWVCPECETGRLAPSRMAANDTRRYCLDCSAKSPKLVEMVCPALEREREERREARLARERRKRQRERERLYILDDGHDLRAIKRRVDGLSVWEAESDRARWLLRDMELPTAQDLRGQPHYSAVMDIIERYTKVLVDGSKVPATTANAQAILLHAGCEYFGLDTRSVRQLHRVRRNLRGRPRDMNYTPTIIAAAKAAGR